MTSTYAPPAQTPDRSIRNPPDPSSFDRVEWQTTDMEQARSQLEALYDGRQFRAHGATDDFRFRFASAGDARLSLQTGMFLGHLQGVIPWSRDYVMSWFRSGSVTIDYPKGQLTSEGSTPFLTPTETSFSFNMTPHRHGIVHIDAHFLEHIAAEQHDGPSQRIIFDYVVTPAAEALATWRETLGRATPLIVDGGVPSLTRHSAQVALVLALLDLFPWRAVDVPEKIRTERTRRLRLAAEFVHAHAERPITTADMAAAAGMHPRSLQLSMSEHLGASPTNYLRGVRLDRVRQDLLSAEPGETRVSEVARAWGFGNLGRFSSAYVARFSEYPRDTLSS